MPPPAVVPVLDDSGMSFLCNLILLVPLSAFLFLDGCAR
jgi:hypothetical protein